MLNIKTVDSFDYEKWDSFIDSSNNGTIFHKLKFLSYHPKDKFKFCNLVFYEEGKIVAVLPGSLEKSIFRSPSGASYGSFVTRDLSFNQYEEIIDTFIEYCRKKRILEAYLTASPIFYMSKQNEIEKFIFAYKKFKIRHHLISNSLDLRTISNSKNMILESFTPMFRRAVRKSIGKNVKTVFNNDVKTFYKILLENKKKFKTLPTHTLSEIIQLKNLFPEDVKLLMAYSANNDPIGGILLFSCNKNTLLAFYICHYYNYQDLRAVNRLFYEAVVWAKKNGYRFLDLGVSMDTLSKKSMEPSRSLIHFKEGIGTRGYLRTTYYWKNSSL